MRKVGRVRLAATGDGWSLWWPVEAWNALSEVERAAVARRQTDLMTAAKRIDARQYEV